MKIIAFLLLICITAATLLDSSQALRRIKRSLPPLANATKVAQDFVELQTREKDNEANLKEEHQMNAPAAETVVDFKEGNKPNSNEFTSNNKREQHQQLVNNNNNNNEKHFGPKQEQRSLHLGNSALAYLLQNKANRKLNGMPQLFAPIDGAVNVRGSHPAESVLISSGKGRSAFRDMRGSIACNAKKIADLSISNNNGNGNEYSNNDNANKCGGFNDNNNNNFDVGNNNNNNNNMKMSAFESSNYNKNNNYDSDGKTLTGVDQLQLENPMHDQQPESATCAAPPQQQQQQPNDQQEKQQQNSGQGPGQGSVVLSIPHTGTAKPEGNMKNIGSHNNRYEPMENVLKLANILLYKLDNLPPFRTGGTQIFLSPNGNSLPVALPDTEDFDSIDYLYNNPLENNVNNQHSPIATVTTSPVPISVPLLPPLFFQSQFALHEPSAQPMNLIETALDKLLTNGAMESEDSDGDELELRCPIHHDAIKRNGTKGNVKDDIIQVCSCRFFKKKKNT